MSSPNLPVRVRFAPSPTGYLNIGGMRSALFNYLFAKHSDGTFILRVEDTDRERLVPDAVDNMVESLKWLGLNPDELPGAGEYGPYTQSERLDIYKKYADELLEKGLLYKEYSSPERLAELRATAQKEKQAFRFTKDQAQLEPDDNDKYVLRFQIQAGNDVTWEDGVWGAQHIRRDTLDDFVAIKSDGYPTYHFANIVDDHLMKISHVIRAAEWISSTPKHILLYEAFGWDAPVFAHLPQVLGPDGKAKLSKRHGAEPILTYREKGYLPEAMINYLASLGFNDGTTKEIYTEDELIKVFSLGRVQSSGAVFDPERLDWMNGMYIRGLSLDELYIRCANFWPNEAKKYDDEYKKQVLGLVQERLKYLAELAELTEFFFTDPKVDMKLAPKQVDVGLIADVIAALHDSDFSEADLETHLRALVDEKDVKAGHLFGLIRVAVTGRTAAPGLFETLHTLGKEATLRRLRQI